MRLDRSSRRRSQFEKQYVAFPPPTDVGNVGNDVWPGAHLGWISSVCLSLPDIASSRQKSAAECFSSVRSTLFAGIADYLERLIYGGNTYNPVEICGVLNALILRWRKTERAGVRIVLKGHHHRTYRASYTVDIECDARVVRSSQAKENRVWDRPSCRYVAIDTQTPRHGTELSRGVLFSSKTTKQKNSSSCACKMKSLVSM